MYIYSRMPTSVCFNKKDLQFLVSWSRIPLYAMQKHSLTGDNAKRKLLLCGSLIRFCAMLYIFGIYSTLKIWMKSLKENELGFIVLYPYLIALCACFSFSVYKLPIGLMMMMHQGKSLLKKVASK